LNSEEQSARGSTALRPQMEKETRGSAVEGPDEREEANREAVGRSMTFTANRKNQAGNTPATRRPYPSAVDCTEMADDYCCQDASRAAQGSSPAAFCAFAHRRPSNHRPKISCQHVRVPSFHSSRAFCQVKSKRNSKFEAEKYANYSAHVKLKSVQN
jgi:hypothetical protein